jgi:5-methylcytosine-specific restriction endonuclease McrA
MVLEHCRNYYAANAEKVIERTTRHRAANREKARECGRRQYAANRDKARGQNRRYRETNADKERLRKRHYRIEHPEKSVLYVRRREARKRQLPDTLTLEQWKTALEYWHGCCAYCGNRSNKLTMDHHIALSHAVCPGTVAENIIPACRSCNASKHDSEVYDWLLNKFGEIRTHEIYARILAYFQFVRESAD